MFSVICFGFELVPRGKWQPRGRSDMAENPKTPKNDVNTSTTGKQNNRDKSQERGNPGISWIRQPQSPRTASPYSRIPTPTPYCVTGSEGYQRQDIVKIPCDNAHVVLMPPEKRVAGYIRTFRRGPELELEE